MKSKIKILEHDILPFIKSLTEYMESKGLKIRPLPELKIKRDKKNATNLFGKTAYYNPAEKSVTLFVENRHPKDILRSFAHEMIHHKQNLEGQFNNFGDIGNDPNYAQNNDHLRKMEKEAFLKGNMLFRDWEDTIKNK